MEGLVLLAWSLAVLVIAVVLIVAHLRKTPKLYAVMYYKSLGGPDEPSGVDSVFKSLKKAKAECKRLQMIDDASGGGNSGDCYTVYEVQETEWGKVVKFNIPWVLASDVSSLELPERTTKMLHASGIETVGCLCNLTEEGVVALRNASWRDPWYINHALAKYSLALQSACK
jgi:DNA-directed RNA polymerase alpha subunit